MAISTSSPAGLERPFAIGGKEKMQILTFRALTGATAGTVTADGLSRIDSIFLDGQIKQSAAPTFSGNVATLAFVVPAETAASRVLEDLTFTAVANLGQDGNSITIAKTNTLVHATLVEQDLTFTADLPGTSGNSITIEYVSGGTAGAEVVTVVGNAISVSMDDTPVTGSTATQIKAAIDAKAEAAALVDVVVSGTGSNVQAAETPPVPLAGGSGSFTISVSGTAISIPIQSGVTKASVINTKFAATAAAVALCTCAVSGTGTNAQTAVTATALQNGVTGGARGTILCLGV